MSLSVEGNIKAFILRLTRYRVGCFLKSLRKFTADVKRNPDHKIYDESYTKLFIAFSEMCCLHACFPLGKGDQTDWKNLRENKSVTSRPDIRLMKSGLDITRKEEFDSPLVVAVVQMKIDSDVRGMNSLCDRLESTSCDSFNSATSAGSDAGSSQRPRIEEFLSRRVLGQHVILTLLEISRDHLQKLESATDILLDQRGTIYYSKPFDIMDCEDRSVLIDSLIRLNNIEYEIYK
ncbi:unnamed protein product [Mytilus coruscus]|uniref:Uncharacterized protein n=1 Tax=Mytilus coruscus TaxID=42192 RepID=A0A6J8CNW1_MYTCO|nr:unnamed protein product [Mytilus coruscus]